MDEATAFLDHVIPRLRDEVVALENGDVRPRKDLWSHHDPVTLFGAEAWASGWEQVEPIFDRLAQSFSQGQSCTYDVLGAGVSGDLGCVVAIERSVAGTNGSPPQSFTLRVTTIFRREQGDWKVIHRHGDPYDITSREALNRRSQQGVM
jgi:ketosteroid isomerase-like protein